MPEILFASVRVLVLMVFIALAWRQKNQLMSASSYGYYAIIFGLVILISASTLSLTPGFHRFSGNLFLTDTLVHLFLVEILGYTAGITLVLFGMAAYMPLVQDFVKIQQELDQTQDDYRLLYEQTRSLNQELEFKVNKRTEDLKSKVAELEQTQKDLMVSEKSASLGSLVAGIAHEINSPIGVSVTASSFLSDKLAELTHLMNTDDLKRSDLEQFTTSAAETVNLLETNLARAAKLTSNFRQLVVEQTSDQLVEVNLLNLADNVVTSIKPTLKDKPISIDVDVEPNISLSSYPGQISQILTNLIINSVKHGLAESENGEIKIAASKGQNDAVLKFCDNGVGVPEENMQRLFDPFFTTKRNQGGTGLGLNMVHSSVTQKLKGQIQAYDCKPGLGFEITLPNLSKH